MATLLTAKHHKEDLHANISAHVQALKDTGIIPTLSIVLVGRDPRSVVYIEKKCAEAATLGIRTNVIECAETITQENLIQKIKNLNADTAVHGIIIQLPIPEHLYTPHVLNAVHPHKDVDCLTYENMGRLVLNNPRFIPPTAGAVMTLLQSAVPNLRGKKVAVVGMGALVGKPLSILCAHEKASVRTINSSTPDADTLLRDADIILSGVGIAKRIRKEHVREGSIVIDAGITVADGKVVGDADPALYAIDNIIISPTPGGVGPLTVTLLLSNTVSAAETQTQKKNRSPIWKRFLCILNSRAKAPC
jgi:methylenetetrahydrofolate dehydrogenase (NADP+) / methenyltetrahydrofolate cyclohydrolase